MNSTGFSYAIVTKNYPRLQNTPVLLDSPYRKSKKYALVSKVVHKDNSENIAFIKYSNDLQELQEQAKGYPSWYNYPLGLKKDLQGYITQIE